MDLIPALSSMAVLQLALSFCATKSPYLNQDRGAIWRSVLGLHLLREHCPSYSAKGCQCPIQRPCLYSKLFRTPISPHSQVMRQYPSAPQPYALSPCVGHMSETGQWHTTLQLSLFGQACEFHPEVSNALIRGAQQGIGPNREPLHLCNKTFLNAQGKPSQTPSFLVDDLGLPTHGMVQIQLLSPLKLKQQNRPCQARHFSPRTLFSSLQRRACMLSYFHQGLQVESGFQARMQAAEALQWQHKSLRWQHAERFSQKQKRRIPLGGLVGQCQLDSCALGEELRYLLSFGQYVGVGQHTVLGQGRYRLKWQACQSQAHTEHAA